MSGNGLNESKDSKSHSVIAGVLIVCAVLALFAAKGIIGHFPKPETANTNESMKEAKRLFKTEQKAAQEGRFLNPSEVNQATTSIEKIAATSPAETASRLRQMASDVKHYRSLMEKLTLAGGADPKFLKSMNDLKQKQALVQDAIETVDRVCKSTDLLTASTSYASATKDSGLFIESKILQNISEQLRFCEVHWRKREVDKSGQVVFDVSQQDLNEYNALAHDISDLAAKQLQMFKENADKNVKTMDSVK